MLGGTLRNVSPSRTGSGATGVGQDHNRGPRAMGSGRTINLSSHGKSRAWGRLLGTSALPGAQRGWGTREATRFARARDNRAQRRALALPHRYFQNQGLGQATALGAAETGAPGIWASLTTGTGRSGFGLAPLATGNQGFGPTSALGGTASGGPGQWANPTTGTEISGFGLAQPATGNQGYGQATA